ncbi:MAG TPA: DUF362 domain-containing protein [Deltaproteobacteria bacterium]|nr:DUF362 domain-containing protein [Deltaproteobacteria bacterium]
MAATGRVWKAEFSGRWQEPVAALLDASGLAGEIGERRRVLIKPNLVEALAPPVTTPAALVEAVVAYVRRRLPRCEVVIGDGTGSLDYDTFHAFRVLGYEELARRRSVRLVDLNTEPLERLEDPALERWPVLFLPRIVMESFLISVPVLKAHTLAGVTLTMKNMMGAAPPLHYQAGGHWKKSAFHAGIHEAVADLNRYRSPDFTVLDATVGMSEAHLWGPTCDPPPGLISAGFDPVAADAYGAALLGRDWRSIGHIAAVDGELGRAAPVEVVDVSCAGGNLL